MRSLVSHGTRSVFVFALSLAACKDDKPQNNPPPPPPPSATAAKAGACAKGGELTDSVSAPFLPKTVNGYCVDPQGEVKTYGEKAKHTMDEVCTSAFDGECEVYKQFGLKRVVSLHYVDGSGKGGSVEVNLSQFGDEAGAYGMFTLRVVAGDPAEPSTPKPLAAGGAAAIGTGRAYVWRGQHLAELQYVNEQESPQELAKSSEAILSAVAKDIGGKLPGAAALPVAAQALPTEGRIPNGVVFQPKDVLGAKGIGPAATGFYKDGDRRWRVVSIVKDDPEQAKDAFKTLKAKPGSLPIANLGDDAAHVVIAPDKGGGPKIEALVVRKGKTVYGVTDEEYALREAGGGEKEAKARLTKDEAVAKMKPLLAGASGQGASAPASAAPSASSAPKK